MDSRNLGKRKLQGRECDQNRGDQNNGVRMRFERDAIHIDEERIDDETEYKPTWRKIKNKLQKKIEEKRIEEYRTKEQQSQTYREQEEECHIWLNQSLHGRKTASIMTMLEQMVEARCWKVARGLAHDKRCRACKGNDETVEHLVAGCKVLAGQEYLSRHNRALMILAVNWAKENDLLDDKTVWYKEKWERGKVLENQNAKLVWDFEFHLRKTTTARRPDLTLEDKRQKKVWICDMTCPQQRNIEEKRVEKMTKYRQLAFEMRERRPGYEVKIIPIAIGALGGGMQQARLDVAKIFTEDTLVDRTVCEMQKTILMDSETLLRKVLSGLIQEMEVNDN